MNNHVNCYKFYNKKGQRLSTFCRFVTENQAEIFLLPCSKNEQFSKQFARNLYALYLNGKNLVKDLDIKSYSVILIDIVPEEGTLKTLLRYAYNNLYYKASVRRYSYIDVIKPINHGSK